jgi:hypothetical protein
MGGMAGMGDPFRACEVDGTTNGVCFSTSATSAPAGTFGCDGFTGAQNAACVDLLNCLRGTQCAAQIAAANSNDASDYPFNDDATPCLCGSGPPGQTKAMCLGSTTWAGVCQAKFATAAGGASLVAGHFFDTSLPIGVAVNLFSCDVDNTCIPAAGVP